MTSSTSPRWKQASSNSMRDVSGSRMSRAIRSRCFDNALTKRTSNYCSTWPSRGWRLHRHWFERSALGGLLGGDSALADIHALYARHDRLLEHKPAVFDHLVNRWRDLFNARFDVLLYDLTS